MNYFFFNKYINQQHRYAYKKLHHRTGKLGTDKCVRIAGFHTSADNVKGRKGHCGQNRVTDHQGSHIISRVLAVQEKYKTGKQ